PRTTVHSSCRFFFFQAEDGIRDRNVTGVQTCALPILRAPVIINIVQEHMVNHCDSNLIAPVVKKLAERASVEVALNFDHGEETGLLKKALTDGYTSVMVDASRYDLEGNIKMTREIVKFAEAFDASVEGEIGCMGASEGDQYTDDDMKTDPEEALKFARETGVDAL